MSVTAEEAVRQAVAFARSQPELLAAVVAGLVAVVGGGYVLRWVTRPAGVRFASMLAEHEEIAVLTHPKPDPDAMAAAMGVASLAEQVGTDATLNFPGKIRHQENRAFRNVLRLDLDCIERAEDLGSESVVLVDHNESRGFSGAGRVRPIAVVDHHPGGGEGEIFTDVRTGYGACSSVIAEYFEDLDATPVSPESTESETESTYVVPSRVATGLFFGILTDTNRLTSGIDPADFAASSYLSAGVDESALDRIANPQVSAETLEIKATAIRERQVDGAFAISDVGDISNVDAIPQAADELILLEGITAAVVYGARNGVLHLSGRSRDDRVHMGRVIDAALTDIPGGNGGGHARMGGGQIAIDDGEFVWPGRRNTLTDRLWRALEGDL
jgi:nanoRNase/pAp phosphatase (c-di-AMP/oligoRNAs hydrolase)